VLSPAATDYMLLLGQMLEARRKRMCETAILDSMDEAWNRLTDEEIEAINTISKVLSSLMRDL